MRGDRSVNPGDPIRAADARARDEASRASGVRDANARRAVSRSGTVLDAGAPAASMPGAGGFWVQLGTASFPAYAHPFVEVRKSATGRGFVAIDDPRTGTAYEANGLTGLTNKFVWMPNLIGDTYEFVFRRRGSCANTLCVTAFSDVADITGASVTLSRQWTDTSVTPSVIHDDAYPLSPAVVTNSAGRACIPLPAVTLANPGAAPTIDPVGGGTTGGTLAVAAYTASLTYRTHYGETAAGPSSSFQVGVPDPTALPLAPITGGSAGTRTGSLAVGTYWVKHTYQDGTGSTRAGFPVAVSVGTPDATGTLYPGVVYDTPTALPDGTYAVRWAATDGTDETAAIDPGGFTQVTGETYGLVGTPGLPAGCTGINVYLSDDAGTTWRRQRSNAVGAYNAEVDATILLLTGAFTGPLATPPASNTFPVNDPRVSFGATATPRPNATAKSLYIATTANGTYRLYASGITADTFDMTAAYPGSGAAPPTLNTTARGIPRATFTPDAGSLAARVYARRLDSPLACVWFESATSPRDLTGGTSGTGCPPPDNTTAWGRWCATVTPDGYEPASRCVTVTTRCGTYEIVFPRARAAIGVTRCHGGIGSGSLPATNAHGAAVTLDGPGGAFTYSGAFTGPAGGISYQTVIVPWPGEYTLGASQDPWGTCGATITVATDTFAGYDVCILSAGPDLVCGCSFDGPVPRVLYGSDKYGSFEMTWNGSAYVGSNGGHDDEAGDAADCAVGYGTVTFPCVKVGGTVNILYTLTCGSVGGQTGYFLHKDVAICSVPPAQVAVYNFCFGATAHQRVKVGPVAGTIHDEPFAATNFLGPISLTFGLNDTDLSDGQVPNTGTRGFGDTVTFTS